MNELNEAFEKTANTLDNHNRRLTEIERREINNDAFNSFGNVISMMKMFPGVAGIWSTAVTDANGQLIDISGNGLHMTANNTPQFGSFSNLLAPLVSYSAASSQYHSLSSAIGSTTDINGNESYIRSSQQGLTVCCVVNFTSTPASFVYLMSKSAAALSWVLFKNPSNIIGFAIYNGASATLVSSSITVAANTNYIISARFNPSTGIYLRVNEDQQQNTTSIPATIDSTASPLVIGARGTPSNYFDGAFSLGLLSAAYASDNIENAWYSMTKSLFGV